MSQTSTTAQLTDKNKIYQVEENNQQQTNQLLQSNTNPEQIELQTLHLPNNQTKHPETSSKVDWR